MGCTGCDLYHDDPDRNHCYAASLARRWGGKKGWPESFTFPEIFDYRIPQALSWPDLTGEDRPGKPWLNGYPRVVFVNDLGDGFCPDVDPDEWLTPHLEDMAASPHVWLLLTKWPGRMAAYFDEIGKVPLNLWPGTTVTRQRDTWRVVDLFDLPDYATTWVSAEPLLGSVDLQNVVVDKSADGNDYMLDALSGRGWFKVTCIDGNMHEPHPRGGVSWVVGGGESGRNARPTDPEWARALRDQCRDAEIPWFWKQWGPFLHTSQAVPGVHYAERQPPSGDHFLKCADKYAAGRLLDGREHSGMPDWTPF
jgi:protein gp37